jgi:cytidylate kinase
MRAIRGATLVAENTKAEIMGKTKEMLSKMISDNDVLISSIISVVFSATEDVTACYPAAAARAMGITDAGLMCMQEMKSESETGIPMCIRAMMTIESDLLQKSVSHVYINGAEVLRPDLINKFKSIAIDGPCGSGKSTVAKMVAEKLGYLHVDTGAMYRAVAYYCLTAGISLTDEKKIAEVIKDKIEITLKRNENNEQRLFLNGDNDITDLIRTQQIAEGTSVVAKIKEVREKLTEMQRKLAKNDNVVMDGRDIGSFVLKDANLKIYLDASVETRAKRRMNELLNRKIDADFETVKKETEIRDLRDSTREHSPLIKASDAKVIDTSDMDIDEVVKYIVELTN